MKFFPYIAFGQGEKPSGYEEREGVDRPDEKGGKEPDVYTPKRSPVEAEARERTEADREEARALLERQGDLPGEWEGLEDFSDAQEDARRAAVASDIQNLPERLQGDAERIATDPDAYYELLASDGYADLSSSEKKQLKDIKNAADQATFDQELGESDLDDDEQKEWEEIQEEDDPEQKALRSDDLRSRVQERLSGGGEAGGTLAWPPGLDVESVEGKGGEVLRIAKQELDAGISEQGNPERIAEYHQASGNGGGTETPWCMSFIVWCCKKAGLDVPNTAWARDGINFGQQIPNDKPGSLRVVQRGEGGHIGINLGNGLILGGNQGNRVSIKQENRPPVGTGNVDLG